MTLRSPGMSAPRKKSFRSNWARATGRLPRAKTINMAPNLNATGITTGDFDGDGKRDLGVISNTANEVYF